VFSDSDFTVVKAVEKIAEPGNLSACTFILLNQR
jgi:hypothetical protein